MPKMHEALSQLLMQNRKDFLPVQLTRLTLFSTLLLSGCCATSENVVNFSYTRKIITLWPE